MKAFIDEVKRMASEGISIAVDFDSTIALTDGYPNIIAPNGRVFDILHKWQDMGCKIILNTIRWGDELEKAIAWCANCGFFFDSVNCNPEYERKFGNESKKLYATFFIDDKNIGTPMTEKHSVFGNYDIRFHVDWDGIDRMTTPVLEKIIETINSENE